MIKLKDILREVLLSEITENTTLYHRSPIKLNPGDIILPRKDTSGKHWLESKEAEIALEAIRRKENPTAPSRFNCVYSTLIPRSRFVDKGYLYAIKPKGNIHIANSVLIDDIGEKFDRAMYDYFNDSDKREYLEQMKADNFDGYLQMLLSLVPYDAYYYWEKNHMSQSYIRHNLKNIEVLSNSAIVIEEIVESEKATPFKIDDKVRVTESDKLYVYKAYLYINTPDYGKTDKTKLSDTDMNNIVEHIKMNVIDAGGKDTKVEIKKHNPNTKDEYTVVAFTGTLKKGAEFYIASLRHQMALPQDSDENIYMKYDSITLDLIVDGKRIYTDASKNDMAIYTRISVRPSYDKQYEQYNIAKYFKKI